VMGAVFASATGATTLASALPADVAHGMQTTFAVSAGLIVLALLFAVAGRSAPVRQRIPELSRQ